MFHQEPILIRHEIDHTSISGKVVVYARNANEATSAARREIAERFGERFGEIAQLRVYDLGPSVTPGTLWYEVVYHISRLGGP